MSVAKERNNLELEHGSDVDFELQQGGGQNPANRNEATSRPTMLEQGKCATG